MFAQYVSVKPTISSSCTFLDIQFSVWRVAALCFMLCLGLGTTNSQGQENIVVWTFLAGISNRLLKVLLQQAQLKKKHGWEDLQVSLKISSNPKPLMIQMPHEDLNLSCPFGLLVTCNSTTRITVNTVRTLTYPWFCTTWAVWRLVFLSLVERYFCDVCSFEALKPEAVSHVSSGKNLSNGWISVAVIHFAVIVWRFPFTEQVQEKVALIKGCWKSHNTPPTRVQDEL